MAEKNDLENLGDDLGQRQRQFLLELSSARQDRVPSPEIAFARKMQSNDVISCYTIIVVSFAHCISASWDGPRGQNSQPNVKELNNVYNVPPYAVATTFLAAISSLVRCGSPSSGRRSMRLAATDDIALPFNCRIVVQRNSCSLKSELLPIVLAHDGKVFLTLCMKLLSYAQLSSENVRPETS